MVPEIGVVIGLYVIARLLPTRWKAASAIAACLAGLAAALVVADMVSRATVDHGLLERKKVAEAPVAPPAKSATGETVKATVTRADGGSITTTLGYGYAVAKGSTLRREFIAVHDPALPVELVGTPGVVTVYRSPENQYSHGEYRYNSNFSVKPAVPISAFEVSFITFDVWGDDVRRLNFQQVSDLAAGNESANQGEWPIYGEQEVENHYASIAYVARVRLADGRVLNADPAPVLAEARRFNAKFTAEELEPEAKPTKAPMAS